MGRWERTHAKLRETALRLFATQGYEATGTAAIARAAGVSEMTLFRHFPSKEELLLQDPYDPRMAEAVRLRPDHEPAMRALAEGIRSAWRELEPQELAQLRTVLELVAATPALRGALERSGRDTATALASALEERGVPPAQAQVAAAAALSGLSAALLAWAAGPGTGLREHVEGALDVLGGGPGC
ncbi:MAG: helix-turn-helix domain-containing protein [Pseudoclavibacter sp.]|nr:helix-turn-helix domain-containing protein [Pseudoclavibacter sp.]